MKTFFLKISILCVIVVAADFALGSLLGYISSSISVGGQGRDNYIANDSQDDIYVFGSSRAVHHYNSEIIEEGLGLPCYNCGDDGAGIILAYGRLEMIKERHKPQIIIYDVNPDFDLKVNDNHKYLGWLKSHYEKSCIRPIFYSVDKTERLKMMSHLYRYNSRFLQNIFVYLTGRANDGGIKGYRPLSGEFDRMRTRSDKQLDQMKDYRIDSLKLSYINKFIKSSEGSSLYFVLSPIWYGMDSLEVQPIRDLCKQNSIPFYDYSSDSRYIHNDDLFKDGSHLNSSGADAFTNELVMRILMDRRNID